MIIKSFELDRVKNSNLNIHLIYGNNEGIKEDIINNYYLKNFDGEILKYDEHEILSKVEEFASNLFNKSLFDSSKLIIISRTTDNQPLDGRSTAVAAQASALEGEKLMQSLSPVTAWHE